MRSSLALVVFALVACGKDPGGTNPTPDADNSTPPAFEIRSSDIMLTPGQQVTYCYYFHTPNTTTLAVNRWVSDMTQGSHHMIFFVNRQSQPADGTIDQSCGSGAGGNAPIWTY